MKLSARPDLNPSRLAALGFFVVIGLVANVIQVTQSIAAGEFSILTISVGVLVVVVVVVLGRSWLKTRRETVRAAGASDTVAAVVAGCLVLMTLSVLTVAVTTVVLAMVRPVSGSPASTQAAAAPDRAAVGSGHPTAVPGTDTAASPPGAPLGQRPDAATSFGNGTYVVGVDIKAGVYRTAGPVSGDITCIWERRKDTSGEPSASIAHGFAQGPTSVTIKETDGAFESQFCQNWTKVN